MSYKKAIADKNGGTLVDYTAEESSAQDVYESTRQAEQNELKKTQYQRDRLKEYPTIEECVHAILDNELDALQVKRQAVKKKYPKENR